LKKARKFSSPGKQVAPLLEKGLEERRSEKLDKINPTVELFSSNPRTIRRIA